MEVENGRKGHTVYFHLRRESRRMGDMIPFLKDFRWYFLEVERLKLWSR